MQRLVVYLTTPNMRNTSSIVIEILYRILEKLTNIEHAENRLIGLLAPSVANELETWLSKEQAMDYIGIKKSTYYRWVEQGILVPRGEAGQDKFLKTDLKKLVEERKYRKRRKSSRRDNGASRRGSKGS